MKLAFFSVLGLLYFGLDTGLTWWFKRTFGQDDNFIGKNAPDEVQRFFGRAVYFALAYYLLVFIYLPTGLDFGGLISNVL